MPSKIKPVLVLATLCLVSPAGAVEKSAATKPNVIVIYTDDHGYSDLGCMGIKTDLKTPNMDALAKGGVRMTQGYITAPQCSPSRCGLTCKNGARRSSPPDSSNRSGTQLCDTSTSILTVKPTWHPESKTVVKTAMLFRKSYAVPNQKPPQQHQLPQWNSFLYEAPANGHRRLLDRRV